MCVRIYRSVHIQRNTGCFREKLAASLWYKLLERTISISFKIYVAFYTKPKFDLFELNIRIMRRKAKSNTQFIGNHNSDRDMKIADRKDTTGVDIKRQTTPLTSRADSTSENGKLCSQDDQNANSLDNVVTSGKPASTSPTGNQLSHSDCDSTQHDLTCSFDAVTENRQVNTQHQQYQGWVCYPPQVNPTPQMPIVSVNPYPPQQSVPIPVVALPQYNSQLPFPDKSGNFAHMFSPSSAFQSSPPGQLGACLGYPTVYVSPAGFITVLLRYDVAVEMTVDRNIRLVNHRHKVVAATNSRGSSNYVYHVVAKVFQEGTKTEVDVFGERRARMQTDGILFASGMEVYLLDERHIIPSHFCFNDMSKDCSVNILFNSAAEFANEALVRCEEITKNTRYFYHKNGATTTIINNIRIHQNEFGEVRVSSGPKTISTSPVYGSVHLQTHFVDISVQVCRLYLN